MTTTVLANQASRCPRYGGLLLGLLLFASVSGARSNINAWDALCAMTDLVHRSIALEFVKLDPYRIVDANRRDIDLDAPLCTARTVKEGLVNGTCNPVSMKRCGEQCIALTIDPAVYKRAANQIQLALIDPCKSLASLKLTDRLDSRPSFFYLGRNSSLAALGCSSTPIQILSSTFNGNTLTIRYGERRPY